MTRQPPSLEQLRKLPKVDLHRHLEGALRPATLWEFHQQQRQTRHESLAALQQSATIARGTRPGFLAFLCCFDALRFKYGGFDAIQRLAVEAVADAAADGVIHLELRFSPVFFARRTYDAAPTQLQQPDSPQLVEEAAGAIVAAAQAEARRRGISVGFILSLGRHLSPAVNQPAAALLERPVGKHFCAIDLAGDEAISAAEFAPFFMAWRKAGRGITLHAGEANPGPGADGVIEAFERYGVDRIGHGVRAVENPTAVAMLARERLPLEVCLTSNVQTHASASYAKHQIQKLVASDVRVTLNSDDPAISNVTLSDEYFAALTECGLSWDQVGNIAASGALAAFLPQNERHELAERIASAWAT